MEKMVPSPRMLRGKAQILKAHARYTSNLFLKLALLVLGLVLTVEITSAQADVKTTFNNLNADGVILDGYDAVAFFTDHRPVKGVADFQFSYKGATYYFASAQHRDLFQQNPEKYEPQFGGWCAYAVSLGRVAPIDVNTFSIENGRLFLQHNQRAVNGWNADVQGNIIKADKYWPRVAQAMGSQIVTDEEKGFLNNINENGVILQGYDAVAYFTDQRAVLGNPQYEARYQGATYWFATAEHASLFKDDPAKYAPQYGGFCGYAMSLNKLRPIDPQIFQLVDGRLVLQHTQDAYEQFNKNLAANTARADQNWPRQVKKHHGRKVKFDKPAKPKK